MIKSFTQVFDRLPSNSIAIIHTNDVHGCIDGYAKVATLKKAYQDEGIYVLLGDAGDFAQGGCPTFYRPGSILRVNTQSVEGKPFDISANFIVDLNGHIAASGSTYHVFTQAFDSQDTGLLIDELVVDYIIENKFNGVIMASDYGDIRGRITIPKCPSENCDDI